jgi:hypothetical protein
MRLLGDGKTTLEIAAKLKISMKTVQAYCDRLKQKLDAANRSRLIRIAVLWRAGVAEIVARGNSSSTGWQKLCTGRKRR